MGWGGFYPWGGDIGQPAAFQVATESNFSKLVRDPFAEFDFILEGIPYRQGEIAASWPFPWGAEPWGYGGDSRLQKIYYSYRGLTTSTTDQPANYYMPAILQTPINYQVEVPVSGQIGTGAGGFGVIEFAANIDDDIEAYWKGRRFVLKLGGTFDKGLATETTLQYSNYSSIAHLHVQDMTYDEDTAQLLVADPLQLLNHVIQQNTYTGSGTYEGDDQIKGQYKPLCYGQPFNVPAVLVNNASNIYQVNDGAVSDITDVRVNGKSLSDQGNTTDLPGWTGGSAGQYKTDIGRGCFRLWAAPDGEVTADVTMTITGAGMVLREMAMDIGVLLIDEGSFYAYSNATIGVYIDTVSVPAAQIMQQITASLDTFMYVNRHGLIALGNHANIPVQMAEYTLEGRREADAPCVIVSIERVETPPAPHKIGVAYKRNWSPQSTDSLDATLTELQKQLYQRPYSATSKVKNFDVLNIDPSAPELFIEDGFLVDEADAILLRDDILRRTGVKRDMYRLTITAPMFQIKPGELVKIFYDRFGLDGGRNAEVVGLVETADTTELTVLSVQ
jgi:hypothetical protein